MALLPPLALTPVTQVLFNSPLPCFLVCPSPPRFARSSLLSSSVALTPPLALTPVTQVLFNSPLVFRSPPRSSLSVFWVALTPPLALMPVIQVLLKVLFRVLAQLVCLFPAPSALFLQVQGNCSCFFVPRSLPSSLWWRPSCTSLVGVGVCFRCLCVLLKLWPLVGSVCVVYIFVFFVHHTVGARTGPTTLCKEMGWLQLFAVRASTSTCCTGFAGEAGPLSFCFQPNAERDVGGGWTHRGCIQPHRRTQASCLYLW